MTTEKEKSKTIHEITIRKEGFEGMLAAESGQGRSYLYHSQLTSNQDTFTLPGKVSYTRLRGNSILLRRQQIKKKSTNTIIS